MITKTLKNWGISNLGDAVDIIDGDRGKNYPKQDEFFDSGYCLFLNTKNVPSNTFFFEEKKFIAKEKDSVLRKGKLERGDFVLTTRGTVGNFAYFSDKVPFENIRINSGMVILRPKKDGKLFSGFFKFYLDCPLFRNQVKSRSSGSAQPQLPIRDLSTFEIEIPELETQKQITDVLSTYDDLIENNTRRIQILEQMAQAIYTEWFVNFRFPGHEKVKMVESGTDFGKIPEGWEIVKIGDIADFMNGFAFKPKHLGTGGLPIIKIPELRSGILNKTPRNSGESIPKKYLIKTGDILFSWSATLLVNIWNSGDGLLNQHLFKVSPKNNNLRSYIYYLLTNQIEKYRSHAVGATMQHLRRDVVLNANCLLPDEKLLTQFEEIASNILKEISALTIQNQTLLQTRNLLLPKLVTGEIRI